jgi:hypothetical protein
MDDAGPDRRLLRQGVGKSAQEGVALRWNDRLRRLHHCRVFVVSQRHRRVRHGGRP